jgi:hypothetical protein
MLTVPSARDREDKPMRMRYRERDLAVVAVAALGAGYLLGQSMQEPPAPLPLQARDGDGMTIVRRLELPMRVPMQNWADELEQLRVPLKPQLIPALQVTTPPDDKPPPIDTTPQERATLQAPSAAPDKPRDICAPGRREEFRYRGVWRWRCRY